MLELQCGRLPIVVGGVFVRELLCWKLHFFVRVSLL